jgi:RHS repeat-associated protein
MFAGEQYDSRARQNSTGLYYLRARYYDPAIGRFLSADPLAGAPAQPQTLNRYAYALNNPVNRVDPTGLASEGAGGLNGLLRECSTELLIVAAFFIAVGIGLVGLWGWGVAGAFAAGATIEAFHAGAQLGWLLGAAGLIGGVGGGLTIAQACGGSSDFR